MKSCVEARPNADASSTELRGAAMASAAPHVVEPVGRLRACDAGDSGSTATILRLPDRTAAGGSDHVSEHAANRARLRADAGARDRLLRERDWSESELVAMQVGLDAAGRLSFPIRNPRGALRGLSRHRFAVDAGPKVIAPAGCAHELFPHLASLPPDCTVRVCEGEPAAVSLRASGRYAVAIRGADAWRPEMAAQFEGRGVVLVPDCDEPGRRLMAQVRRDLGGLATSVETRDLDVSRDDGYDPCDHLQAFGRAATRAATAVAAVTPAEAPAEPRRDEPPGTPTLLPTGFNPNYADAVYGVLGEFVTALDRYTEADPAAVLVQALADAGCRMGFGPYAAAGSRRLHANLCVVVVGDTAIGRKGTAANDAMLLGKLGEPEWASGNVVTGLTSGEGLIERLRDRVEGAVGGVEDKRLKVFEPEFASPLKKMGREGSVLSPVLRLAADSEDLQVMTRKAPYRATAPHVTIVGHSTPDELRRTMPASELANGLGNRFLFIRAEMSKRLPHGDSMPDELLRAFVKRVTEGVEFGKEAGEVRRDTEADALWEREYNRMLDEAAADGGAVGQLTARAPAHVMTLAVIYALLDKSKKIRVEHLRAALALVALCRATVIEIWGDRSADPIADEIAAALGDAPEGLTRSEISDLGGRNWKRSRVDAALTSLADSGRARMERHPPAGGRGRHVEHWFACTPDAVTGDVAVEAAAERLCVLLADLLEGDGKYRRPRVTVEWRDAARRLLTDDSQEEKEVERVIRWSQTEGGWWRGKVLGLPKLREHYDTMRRQADEESASRGPSWQRGHLRQPGSFAADMEARRRLREAGQPCEDDVDTSWLAQPTGEVA